MKCGLRRREELLLEIMRNRLPELRAEKGLSQGQLGEKLGVSRQTVNALEKGKYDPSLPLAFKIARYFNLRIEEIFLDGSVNDPK